MTTIVFSTHPILHLQISMKKCCRTHDFRRWILRPRLINFDGNLYCFSIVLLSRFVRFLRAQINMMLLEESEKVNKTLDIEQKSRFV